MSADDHALEVSYEDLTDEQALRQMYRISVDDEQPFREKLRHLLLLGRDYLDVEVGFLTRIEEDEQLITEAVGEHPLLQPGDSCPLNRSYCRKTIEKDEALTVQHAMVEGWEDDPAYEKFGLESYVGAKVVVDGSIHGTFCFADTEPMSDPHTPSQVMLVELMALWVGYEISQQQAIERIEAQREQLEEQNERLSEFAGIVSHDLRNPLSVAKIRVELARDGVEGDHLPVIDQALDRMDELIDDVLTWAREGGAVGEKQTIDLATAVEAWWEAVNTQEASVNVETDASIEADRSRLQQLFENLFRNAIEHGGPDVTVTIGDLEDGFYVEDDGPGIPKTDHDQVFEAGYTTRDDGTGFGLNIVKEIASAHDWEIRVKDSTHGGARFEFFEIG